MHPHPSLSLSPILPTPSLPNVTALSSTCNLDALALDTLLRSGGEDVDQNCPRTAAQSNLSESLTTAQQPSKASLIPNAIFLAPGTLGHQNLDQIPKTHEANNNLPSAAIDTHMIKRVILGESGHQLEDVMEALGEAGDTSRIPNSPLAL